MSQSTSHILMIRPVNFGFNEETAGSNAFQSPGAAEHNIQHEALKEFTGLAGVLVANGVDVTIIDDTKEPYTPDSIFPNNWVSFHEDGTVFLYPMQAENRRLERREDIINDLEDNFTVKHVIDLSRFEREHKFLEGTGSMVLDRENKIAYACLSPRTNKDVLYAFCGESGYKPVVFSASDANGTDIYHTNVLMCVGSKFVVICLESIKDTVERQHVENAINGTGKELIEISLQQMGHFAGNMLELTNKENEPLLVMSKSAYGSLLHEQKVRLERHCKILFADLHTIESNGGGSARCMIAEVHLPVSLS